MRLLCALSSRWPAPSDAAAEGLSDAVTAATKSPGVGGPVTTAPVAGDGWSRARPGPGASSSSIPASVAGILTRLSPKSTAHVRRAARRTLTFWSKCTAVSRAPVSAEVAIQKFSASSIESESTSQISGSSASSLKLSAS